jgi:hypothetical protein
MDIIRSTAKKELKVVTALNQLCLKTGLLVCLSMILYFFMMKALGLQHILILRALNMVFLGTGIIWALNRYSKLIRRKLEYFTGIRIGALISLVASVPFALFIGIYLRADVDFMNFLTEHMSLGEYLTPPAAAVAVLAEGIASGFLITFVVMPYFKRQ